MEPHRKTRLDWDSHGMLIAIITSQRSPDPNTQVGAYICDKYRRTISTGYNGTPRNINPRTTPWNRTANNKYDTKYPYVVHAELNAIINATRDLKDATLYCTLHPCSECAKSIMQAGIREVIYLNNYHEDSWQADIEFSNKLMKSADLIVRDMKIPNEHLQLLQHTLKII